jgi:amino acid transporter
MAEPAGASPPPPPPRRRLWRAIIGAPRDVADPRILQHVSLVAFLAWVGLGADGLSSSAYGPEEAYKALGTHAYLAVFLAAMMAATIAIISIAYANVIEHFPGGGGGYLVASKLLGNRVGVVSGAALLVDYVLTITISIASACDQIWSFLPVGWQRYKVFGALIGIALLLVLNLRGVKESVKILAPVFLLFVVTHAVAILYALLSRAAALPAVFHGAGSELRQSVGTLGVFPVLLILLRAYSLGGGTYTGIEAVSNGVATLREPRVRTGKRTMALMASSLAFTAGGILIGYLLTGAQPAVGKTMNAVLLESVFGGWHPGGVAVGLGFVVVSLVAEAALLFVAAQAGFLDGPRVLANMALDSWMPHRFAHLSDRLVAQNGVLLMGLAACAALLYTRGDVGHLVVMYSINVFITFSLTELGMFTHYLKERGRERNWKRQLLIQGTGLVMCASILVVTVFEKFSHGGWVTLIITAVVIAFCWWVHRHYERARASLARLDAILGSARAPAAQTALEPAPPLDPKAPTAVICVTSFSGFGLHQVLSVHRSFPNFFKNFIFVSASVIDSGVFKGADEIELLKAETEENLRRYVAWARVHGLHAEYRTGLGTEAIEAVEEICRDVAREFPRSVVFLGKLVFREEHWYHKLLHNETAFTLQRRLQFEGIQAIMLAIRVLDDGRRELARS